MMKLFDILPDRFFSILNGKNREIYAEALLLLYRLINENDMYVKKDEFLRSIKEKLSNEINSFSIEEENEFDDEEILTTFSAKANLILRRLEETGWIELAIDPDNSEEFIILPSYSIIQIESLFNIVNESSEGYSSLVHTTYSELLLEDENRDEFMYATLLRAYENTKKLRVDLISLSHSIKIYQGRLNKLFTSNDVLHSYFDNYKELISDRLYHPLKTFDSVARFKRPIINILESWIKDEEAMKILIKEALIYSKTSIDPKDVELDIISKINYITDMYSQLNKMIDNIDKSHRDYTKSSTNKILYLNNTNKSIKGCLETILVGILSLIAGLIIGIFASQFMSIFVAKLFEAKMSDFTFVFSKEACIKTCIYFAIMYLAVMIFNTITISRYKLINLLTAIKKNESISIKNPVCYWNIELLLLESNSRCSKFFNS